jgi:sugar phosphate permease
MLGYVAAVFVAGLLASRVGPRAVVAVSLSVSGAAMLLTGLVPTFTGARLGRFLAGVGGAGGNVPALALVPAWFGARRRGLAAGAAVGGSSLGLILTGPLVPAILARTGPEGWRLCWYVLGGLAFGLAVLSALFLRNRPAERGLRPLGETEAERRQAEAAAEAPGAVWERLRGAAGTLGHLAVIYSAFGLSYVVYATFFIRFLVGEAGFDPRQAGLLWLLVGVGSGGSGFLWGAVSDRHGRRAALIAVFTLQAAAFFLFGVGRSAPLFYLSAALFALTAWSIPALMTALTGDLFGARLTPAVLGLVTVALGVGQALGPYAAGRIADAAGSFAPAFLLAALVALLVGAGGSFLLPRLPRPESRGTGIPL